MKRIVFIDITKAIAVISMVTLHITMGIESVVPKQTIQPYSDLQQYIFLTWFMAVFFVVTGYCSNYSKPFKPFLKSLIISVGLPIFFFDILVVNITNFITLPTSEAFYLLPFSLLRFFRYSFWFLRALFVAKLMYWAINKILNNRVVPILGVILILYILAGIAVLYGHGEHGCHSIMALALIATGDYVRKNNLLENKMICWGSLIIHIICITTMYVFSYSPPRIQNSILIHNCFDIPLLYIISVSGSIGIMFLSKIIGKNNILEYIGRYSLVIYCFHFIVNKLPFSYFISENSSLSYCLVYLICHTIVTISLCCLFAFVFDRKYLRIVIGKQ